MGKNIYFAASIRGGRELIKTYEAMLVNMRLHHTVLTEQVGNMHHSTDEQMYSQDNLIYKQDVELLTNSDVVIAECTVPSLGVGYELCLAEQLKKPIHVFYNPEMTELSAMIKGNPAYMIHPWFTQVELLTQLHCVLDTLD